MAVVVVAAAAEFRSWKIGYDFIGWLAQKMGRASQNLLDTQSINSRNPVCSRSCRVQCPEDSGDACGDGDKTVIDKHAPLSE